MTSAAHSFHSSPKENGSLQADLVELQGEWDRLNAAYAVLREEQKEDGWLSRFRT
jgi:hypothetical protein